MALGGDCERVEPLKIGKRQCSRFHDQGEGKIKALLDGSGLHRQSFHSQAAPRTPLESPCSALRIGVSNTGEKV